MLAFSAAFWSQVAPVQWDDARLLFWVDLCLGLSALVLSFFLKPNRFLSGELAGKELK